MKWLVPATVALLALLARLAYLFEIQDSPLFSRPVLLQSLEVSLWWLTEGHLDQEEDSGKLARRV